VKPGGGLGHVPQVDLEDVRALYKHYHLDFQLFNYSVATYLSVT
jgi:hypothetical protein